MCHQLLLISTLPYFNRYCRRCTNRVVERGPTSRLEIFRLRGASSSSKQQENTWGVRTLDFIPKNAFVCEVTGQYVLGRTGEDTAASVAGALLQDPAVGTGSADASGGRGVIPVRAWDAPAVHDAGFSPIAWAANQLELDEARTSGTGVTAPIVHGESGVSSGSASQAGGMSRGLSVRELLRSEEHCDQIRNFLRGEVCVSLLMYIAAGVLFVLTCV